MLWKKEYKLKRGSPGGPYGGTIRTIVFSRSYATYWNKRPVYSGIAYEYYLDNPFKTRVIEISKAQKESLDWSTGKTIKIKTPARILLENCYMNGL